MIKTCITRIGRSLLLLLLLLAALARTCPRGERARMMATHTFGGRIDGEEGEEEAARESRE